MGRHRSAHHALGVPPGAGVRVRVLAGVAHVQEVRGAGALAGGTRRAPRDLPHGRPAQSHPALRLGLGLVAHARVHPLRDGPGRRRGAAQGSRRVQATRPHHRGRVTRQRRHRHRRLLAAERDCERRAKDGARDLHVFRVGAHRRGARGREHRRGMPRLARPRRRRGRSHRADLRHAVRVLPLLPRRRIRGFRIWRPRVRRIRGVHRGVRPRFLHRGDGALAAPLLGDAHLRREHGAVHLNGRDHRQDHHGGGDG
mmetsp:Transcript_3889/g.17933  ORF Transcript_3889/g.17933 Transcript_3889/m.17933 type:complete len:255 (-) Transcript_3889:3930-4694(-)